MADYQRRAEFKGSLGAINVLVFSSDGKLLLSGADDERVRVWDTKTFKCKQILQRDTWGQITTLTWLSQPPLSEKCISVCVGTARGSISLCPMSRSNSFSMNEANDILLFEFNDAVETQAYDPLNYRLVVASHSGVIKMFTVEDR
ncbi:WD40-repeat-containing domain protein, partial [Infundibulicybe gibba]